MKLDLVDENREVWREPYLVRLQGWTWRRYLDEAPEMRFCEYQGRELILHSPVDWDHQDIVRFLTYLLTGHCARHGLGKVGNGPAVIEVGHETGREPDIFVVPPEQFSRLHGRRLAVVPSLIVEVVSSSTRSLDLGEKAEEYADLGVLEYWVVDRETRILHVHRLRHGSYRREKVKTGRVESASLRGFWVRADWLWKRPLPPEPVCLDKIEGR